MKAAILFAGVSVAVSGCNEPGKSPAQEARDAANSIKTRDHLHLLGVAIHDYAAANDEAFPPGLLAGGELNRNDRLGWIVPLLPYLEQRNIYKRIDTGKGWNHEANRAALSLRIPMLLHGSYSMSKQPLGVTHFVGITGYGRDSALTSTPINRRGVFGYNRHVTFTQIVNADGTSTTLAITLATEESAAPWAAGTKTLRGFSTKPYFNGPDGIGDSARGGAHVLFADGAVRYLSKETDPRILEAMSTYAGNDRVGDLSR